MHYSTGMMSSPWFSATNCFLFAVVVIYIYTDIGESEPTIRFAQLYHTAITFVVMQLRHYRGCDQGRPRPPLFRLASPVHQFRLSRCGRCAQGELAGLFGTWSAQEINAKFVTVPVVGTFHSKNWKYSTLLCETTFSQRTNLYICSIASVIVLNVRSE